MNFIDLLQQLFDYLLKHGIHDVLPAIGLGFVGYWLTQRLPRLLRGAMTRAHVEPTLTTFVVHVSRYALFIFFHPDNLRRARESLCPVHILHHCHSESAGY